MSTRQCQCNRSQVNQMIAIHLKIHYVISTDLKAPPTRYIQLVKARVPYCTIGNIMDFVLLRLSKQSLSLQIFEPEYTHRKSVTTRIWAIHFVTHNLPLLVQRQTCTLVVLTPSILPSKPFRALELIVAIHLYACIANQGFVTS